MKHNSVACVAGVEEGRGLEGRERGKRVGELAFSSVAEKTGLFRKVILTVRDKVAVAV